MFGPEDVVRDLRHIPSSPQVLPRLLEILRDDRATLEEVVGVIRLDQGTAGRVLQIANSAYYSTSNADRCVSMDEAVHRVGLIRVYELVAYAAAAQLVMRHLRSYGIVPESLWHISVTGAIAAERLATRTGADHRLAYTVGLLHGIGLIAVDSWVQANDAGVQFAWSGLPEEATAEEKRVLGFNNAAVAAALLTRWEFPSEVIEPIRWQYAPTFANGHRRMASLLHAAKWLRDAVHTPPDRPLPPLPEKPTLEAIAMEPLELEALLGEIRDGFLRASLLLAEPEPELV